MDPAMNTLHLATAVLFATTTLAMAQDKVAFTYSGTLSAESLSTNGTSLQLFYGDLYAGVRWPTASNIKMGFDLGLETLNEIGDSQVGGQLNAIYATAVVETQYGKFSIGSPRSVVGDYFSVPNFGGSEFFTLETAYLTGDLFTVIKLESDENIYGARYDGKIGQFSFGASINKPSDNGSFLGGTNLDEIAGQYSVGNWSVSLGATQISASGYSEHSVNFEIQGRTGKVSGGVALSKSNIIGDVLTTRAFASYDVTDQIKVNAQVLNIDVRDSTSQSVYGLDVSYTHVSGAFLQAGIITGTSSENDAVDVTLGYKF
jgi:hypothetical protein